MPRSTIYAGLEIGTSKICVVVGEAKSDGAIKILGVGQAPSRGVRKGEIVDFETAQTCLHDALVRAEDRSDVMIKNVVLSVTGPHLESLNNRGRLTIPEDQNEITEDDLAEVKEIARDVAIPEQNVFLHSIIRHYIVDGQDKVINPVGMLGRKLEADYHIIHGIRNRIQNTIRCVREIPLEVEDVVFAPIAAAQIVLTSAAKEQGALLIDIGGGTTDYVLYADGAVAQSGSIGLGGDHLTNDISIVLKVPLSRAEKLKIEEGNCSLEAPATHGRITMEGDAHFSGRTVDRELLNGVINSRMTEIFELVRNRLLRGEGFDACSAGVYLTGGTSLLKGVATQAEEVLGLPVHRPNTAPISGLTATFENPQYATPIGLIRYAQILENERPNRSAIARLTGKLSEFFTGARLSS
ncbi:MAG: cell division protein FtsA [Verrucomicrobiales bacterium]